MFSLIYSDIEQNAVKAMKSFSYTDDLRFYKKLFENSRFCPMKHSNHTKKEKFILMRVLFFLNLVYFVGKILSFQTASKIYRRGLLTRSAAGLINFSQRIYLF
jgi:hypothetical protein